MIVVSDSTSLIILANEQRFDLLRNLFDVVYVPQAVWNEVQAKQTIELPEFIQLHGVQASKELEMLGYLLDQGESEAIVLAKTLDLPLIIDEKKGRKIASQMGIKIVGLLGIIYLNIKQLHLSTEEAKLFLQMVRDKGFRISQTLIDAMFQQVDRS
jgi:predicted nucleic acid-binding protein